ncbi:hypothetical protein JAO71_07985 [Olleya sp. YSTF-M6]|uniref:Uncharacterized protein n=1 Tax=Olleya sediminilitoris TaxID=2795739 RepID=A0ABS1WKT8_9FLAO|nr:MULTISPECIES: hypothetical protein [Olleya]MBL7559741.1 hypothetical protein [Olleya sediminilitoris]
MENKKALKLIDSIQSNLDATGINTDTLIDDIKQLRTYVLELEVPLAVKVLRYAYEHIEANDSFLIPIPEDSPIEDEDIDVDTTEASTLDPVESLKYLIALIGNLENSMNILDLKYYKKALMDY